MFAPKQQPRAAGIALGYLLDAAVGDPRRGHPVAGFGQVAAVLERATYRDNRLAGAAHVAVLIGGLAGLGWAVGRARPTAAGQLIATAAATWVALGGTTLGNTGLVMADLLDAGDLDAARRLLPSLCGRDPAALDAAGLARAAVESVAENTADAHVAPLLWAALGGVPAVLAYRGINTLDAMIGHRSPRYARFGWAAARLDDLANHLAARVTAVLTAVCAPIVDGRSGAAFAVWRSDAARHPSPNAGVVEAAFAGALDIRLGGPTPYRYGLEIRPTLGDGPAPQVTDLRRAVRLSRAVQAAAVLIAGALAAQRRRP
ncbi:cobalamin biosynthesis protein [Mycobacterium sp. 1274756.6]|uniref:cobalamin biosynthesis protein n=1 Tax=Mycobacterium sp. 1274756.6 TaxID=1834076 RepID=UPI0007FD7452|nr:cobalamin biosynthesis protein [Mycobacterium sp. 1274756.6]OBJ73394.1 adenosylcobinamide-phosphate synthase [Mycobacterium sp. 1274756.6]